MDDTCTRTRQPRGVSERQTGRQMCVSEQCSPYGSIHQATGRRVQQHSSASLTDATKLQGKENKLLHSVCNSVNTMHVFPVFATHVISLDLRSWVTCRARPRCMARGVRRAQAALLWKEPAKKASHAPSFWPSTVNYGKCHAYLRVRCMVGRNELPAYSHFLPELGR